MDPRGKKNVLQTTVSDTRKPLLGRQKRLRGKVRLAFGQPFAERRVKPLAKRRDRLAARDVILVEIAFLVNIDPAVHRDREHQISAVRKGESKLIILRHLVVREESQVDPVAYRKPLPVIENHLRENSETLGPLDPRAADLLFEKRRLRLEKTVFVRFGRQIHRLDRPPGHVFVQLF